MGRKPNVLQGIPSDSAYDYTMPALSSKDIGRDKLVSYTSTKIYNNRPKTFDLTKILEGYTLTGLYEISDNASMIVAWPSETQQGNSTIKLKAARVRIPLIHDGFLPDPLNQDDVNKFGSETIKNLHPLAYLEANNNEGGISGFFGIASTPGPFTRAKIQIKDANLTRFEILSFLNKMTDSPLQEAKASNASGPASSVREATPARKEAAKFCGVADDPANAAKVTKDLRISELYHIVNDFYDPSETSLPVKNVDPPVTSPACRRIDPDPENPGEVKEQKGGHRGTDIGVPVGTPVYATAPGVVIFTGYDDGGGNMIKIIHEPKGYSSLNLTAKEKLQLLYTSYMHLSRINTSAGNAVSAGQLIGYSGESGGHIEGPHLHYETRIYYDVRLQKYEGAASSFMTKAIVLSGFLDPGYSGASSQDISGKFSYPYAEPYRKNNTTKSAKSNNTTSDFEFATTGETMSRLATRDRGVPF